jgi:anti-sigma factor RsiW
MLCKKVRNCLERYVDGMLPAALQASIQQHLLECSACDSAYEEVASLKSLFKESVLPHMPENSVENIMAAVRRSSTYKPQDQNESFPFRWWSETTVSARTVFAGILLAVVAVGGFIGKDLWNNPTPSTFTEDPELEVFSAAQKGSFEYFYVAITAPTFQGVKK